MDLINPNYTNREEVLIDQHYNKYIFFKRYSELFDSVVYSDKSYLDNEQVDIYQYISDNKDKEITIQPELYTPELDVFDNLTVSGMVDSVGLKKLVLLEIGDTDLSHLTQLTHLSIVSSIGCNVILPPNLTSLVIQDCEHISFTFHSESCLELKKIGIIGCEYYKFNNIKFIDHLHIRDSYIDGDMFKDIKHMITYDCIHEEFLDKMKKLDKLTVCELKDVKSLIEVKHVNTLVAQLDVDAIVNVDDFKIHNIPNVYIITNDLDCVRLNEY